jgi:hypothetical protein
MATQHSQQSRYTDDQQRNAVIGWQAPRLEPRTFTAPPMPSYHNPFAYSATSNSLWNARSSIPSSDHPQHSSEDTNADTNEEFNRYPHPNLTDYYKRYPNNPPPPSIYGTGYSNYGGKGPTNYGGYGQQKRDLEKQPPGYAEAKRRRLEDSAWRQQYSWNDPISAANMKRSRY